MSGFRSLLPRLGIAALLGLWAAAPASAAGVLAPYVPPVPRTVAMEPETARQRLVTVDSSALAAAVGPAGLGAGQARIGAKATVGTRLTLDIFPGVSVTLTRISSYPAFGGGIVWIGKTAKPVPAEGVLVVRNGRITGTVNRKGKIYEINPVALTGTVHRVREIAAGRQPDTDFALARRPGKTSPRIGGGGGTSGATEIKVLIAYTDAAYGAFPNMKERANLAVANANRAFTTSNVKIKFTLAGLVWAEYYDETRLAELEPEEDNEACPTVHANGEYPAFEYEKNLKYLVNGCGYLALVKSERERLKADLVTLFVKRKEMCGLGFASSKSTPVSADYAYSIVSVDCIPTYSYSNATGYNMGLLKDRFVTDATLLAGYRFGYVNLIGKFRDIMSEEDRCKAAGITCELVNRFSNPAQNYKGQRFGIPIGQLYQTDATSFLNTHRATVAAFR